MTIEQILEALRAGGQIAFPSVVIFQKAITHPPGKNDKMWRVTVADSLPGSFSDGMPRLGERSGVSAHGATPEEALANLERSAIANLRQRERLAREALATLGLSKES